MALTLAASVTRDELGMGDLNINDHTSYALGVNILGGQVAWQKQQVTSPYIDGDITITRRRPTVMETIEINVYGTNHSTLITRLKTLVQAFSQDTFNLGVSFNGTLRQYQCEAADYSIEYNQPKIHSHQCLVRFSVPRNPIPIAGV